MGSLRLGAVSGAGLVAVAVWLMVPGAASAAKPITVCPSGCSYTSVQAAVDGAPSGATISVAAGTYVGAVTVGKSITLKGAGAGQSILAGGNRTITIDAGSVVTIKSLTVTDGLQGIVNRGTLTLVASTVTGNGPFPGAGIFNEGTATLRDSMVSGNTSITNLAACNFVDPASCTGGAGINNRGTMVLNNSVVSDNVSRGVGGGITSVGDLTLNNSTVTGNASIRPNLDCGDEAPACVANAGGGGIIVGGSFTATNSTISNNTSDDVGGGIWIEGDADHATNATLTGTIVSANTARDGGGGIYSFNANIALANSIVTGNTAPTGNGGGIYNDDGGLISMVNTTVSGNTSGAKGGGIYNHDFGLLMFWTSTITSNSALQGGGIYNDNSTAPIPVRMDGITTVTGNNPDDCVGC